MSILIEEPIDHITPYVEFAIRRQRNLHLSGPSGIGKTTVVRDATEADGRLLCTAILAAMDVGDIGMAAPDTDPRFLSYRMNKALPFVGTEDIWLHPKTGKAPTLFLDEINNAMPYMMNVWQQAVLSGMIHGVPFIPGTVVISAGNRSIDAANVNKISGPFANRFIHLNCLPPTLDGFTAYCRRNNINEWISAYAIHTGGESIHEFDPKRFLVEPAFASPRGWCEHVSPVLDESLPDDQRIALVSGSVGRARAEDFELFYRFRSELPDFNLVCTTGDGPVPKSVSTRIVVVNSCIRHSTHNNIQHIFKYISKLSQTDPEFNDLFEKGLFQKDATFAGHPEYTRWVLKNNRKPITNSANLSAAAAQAPSQPTVDDILQSQPLPTLPYTGGPGTPTIPTTITPVVPRKQRI